MKQMTRHSIYIAGLCLAIGALSGCLRTRGDVSDTDQDQVVSHKVNVSQKEQKEVVDPSAHASELNENIRDLRGRIEVLENKAGDNAANASQSRKNGEEQNKEAMHRLGLLQESVTRLDAQVQSMNSEIAGLKADLASNSKANAETKSSTKNTFEAGMEAFNKKDYKKAILIFQAFREKKPKDKNASEATYRIGLSFQELGMRDEAMTFYDEAISKYPNTDVSKRAHARLKKLKSASSK